MTLTPEDKEWLKENCGDGDGCGCIIAILLFILICLHC